jgi:methyl halide transferase
MPISRMESVYPFNRAIVPSKDGNLSEQKAWLSDNTSRKNVADMRRRFEDIVTLTGGSHNERDVLRLQRNAWNSLWQDKIIPWDIGQPTPALFSELETYHHDLHDSNVFRILVPGCGAGYDLITIALHVENLMKKQRQSEKINTNQSSFAVVVGLDLTEAPLNRAASVIGGTLKRQPPLRSTRIDLVKGDFFEDAGETLFSFGAMDNDSSSHQTSSSDQYGVHNNYNLIYDYTFFCAIPPSLRSRWGQRMAEILVPGQGQLLTLMFPIKLERTTISEDENEDNSQLLNGPPFPVTVQDYEKVLNCHGIQIEESGPRKNADSIPSRAGMELACWWRKTGSSRL